MIQKLNVGQFKSPSDSQFWGNFSLEYQYPNGSLQLAAFSHRFKISDDKSAGESACCRNCSTATTQNGKTFEPCPPPTSDKHSNSDSSSLLPAIIGLGVGLTLLIILLFVLFLFLRRRWMRKAQIVSQGGIENTSVTYSTMSRKSWSQSPSNQSQRREIECELSTHGGPFELGGRGKRPHAVREWLMEGDAVPRLSRPPAALVERGRSDGRSILSERSLPLPPRSLALHAAGSEALLPGTLASAPPKSPLRSFTR